MLTYSPSHKNPPLREGLIFGVILGLILMLFALISLFASGGILGSILSLLDIALVTIGYLVAGIRSSMRTGKVSTGALAGLIAGSIAYALNLVFLLFLTWLNLDRIRALASNATSESILTATFAASLLILIIYGVIAGLIIGALGGRLGRRRYLLQTNPQALSS